MGEIIKLNIICSDAKKFSVRTIGWSKVVEFKDLLAQNSSIPAKEQTLTYRGMILKDDETLDSYGLQADHTIHLVIHGMDMPSIQKRRNLVRIMREVRYRKDMNRLKELLEAAPNPFAGNQENPFA